MRNNDSLGDRIKSYERAFTEERLDKNLPVYARLDGRSFSKFTKKMQRPFDPKMSKTMIAVTGYLVKETKADCGYTQSDEISLLWKPVKGELSQFMFDGKIQKLASVLAGMCSAKFTVEYLYNFGQPPEPVPSFDCRILNVPNETELRNALYWRQIDAFKNSVQSVAHHMFGHTALVFKSTKEKLDMIAGAGVDFFEQPAYFRVGTIVKPEVVEKELVGADLERIPKNHRPDGPVKRTELFSYHPVEIESKWRAK